MCKLSGCTRSTHVTRRACLSGKRFSFSLLTRARARETLPNTRCHVVIPAATFVTAIATPTSETPYQLTTRCKRKDIRCLPPTSGSSAQSNPTLSPPPRTYAARRSARGRKLWGVRWTTGSPAVPTTSRHGHGLRATFRALSSACSRLQVPRRTAVGASLHSPDCQTSPLRTALTSW